MVAKVVAMARTVRSPMPAVPPMTTAVNGVAFEKAGELAREVLTKRTVLMSTILTESKG